VLPQEEEVGQGEVGLIHLEALGAEAELIQLALEEGVELTRVALGEVAELRCLAWAVAEESLALVEVGHCLVVVEVGQER
jgi:hypothetical protein